MKKRKKEKDPFEAFRFDDKSSYRTIKIPIKSILRNYPVVQPVLENIVLDINDLTIHTYQFIRLFILNCYHNGLEVPTLDETFVLYCIRTLGTRDNRGAKCKETELLELLENFYKNEYQSLLSHTKTDLKNKTFMLPYMATQIFTGISNKSPCFVFGLVPFPFLDLFKHSGCSLFTP